MKQLLLLFAMLLITICGFAQETLTNDMDADGLSDTVCYERSLSVIICRLSSQQFRAMQSRPVARQETMAGVRKTRNGFEFFVDWMREGYAVQFRYDKKAGLVQLIGIKNYAFGNAVHSGSGESSANLLTGDYMGNWNEFDMEKEQLTGTPVKGKIQLKKTWLEDFDDSFYENYSDKSMQLYERLKKQVRKR